MERHVWDVKLRGRWFLITVTTLSLLACAGNQVGSGDVHDQTGGIDSADEVDSVEWDGINHGDWLKEEFNDDYKVRYVAKVNNIGIHAISDR